MSNADPNDWSIYLSKFLGLRGIITDLKSTIDQLNSNFENVKKAILELARRLDEGELCERNQICRAIKDILKDKIKQGHITGKWIEDCLPAEYKRKYVKSEGSSLSKRATKAREITIDNNGKAIEETTSPNGSDKKNISPLQNELLEDLSYENERGCPRCSELEEALRKASQVSTADHLAEREIRLTISKDCYEEIKFAMKDGDGFFYIIFDRMNKSFVRAELGLSEPS